jgi:hypothetical protein
MSKLIVSENQQPLFEVPTLPEQIAEKFGFPLPSQQHEGRKVFLVQGWIAGVSQSKAVVKLWNALQTDNPQLSALSRQLPHTAKNGKKYMMDFTDAYGLYVITGHLRAKSGVRDEVIEIMARSTDFVDWANRNPDLAAEGFTKLAGKKRKELPLPQTKDYRLARHSGYSPESALQTAEIRNKLKEQQNIVNDVRKEHGARNADFARLNSLDSEVATGKTPKQWQEEYGTDGTPADFHSALDRALLFQVKREAAKLHEENGSKGLYELEADVLSLEKQTASVRETLHAMLSNEPLTRPTPKGKQMQLGDGRQ